MGVVVVGGGGSGGGGGGNNKVMSDGTVVNEQEEVVGIFGILTDAYTYCNMLNREDARVIPLAK